MKWLYALNVWKYQPRFWHKSAAPFAWYSRMQSCRFSSFLITIWFSFTYWLLLFSSRKPPPKRIVCCGLRHWWTVGCSAQSQPNEQCFRCSRVHRQLTVEILFNGIYNYFIVISLYFSHIIIVRWFKKSATIWINNLISISCLPYIKRRCE